jgi:hypothetical protein
MKKKNRNHLSSVVCPPSSVLRNKEGPPRGQPFHCRAVVRPKSVQRRFQAVATPIEARIQLTDAGDRGDGQ